jgi:hypothetical protein
MYQSTMPNSGGVADWQPNSKKIIEKPIGNFTFDNKE